MVSWVNSDSPNSISAASALCSLIHRPEYNFFLYLFINKYLIYVQD